MIRTISVIGMCLIVLGAATIISPAFGFSSLAADRGVSVSTAGHPDALIGITAQSSTVDKHNKQTEIATVGSNTNAIDITSLDSTDIDVTQSDELLDLTVSQQDNSWSVSGSCTSNKAAGKTDVTITVVDAFGDGVSVHGATRTINDITVSCGDGDFSADWYEFTDEYTGNGQSVAFSIRNTHNESVTVTGLKIDDTSNKPPQSYQVMELDSSNTTDTEVRNEGDYAVGAEEFHDPYTISTDEEVTYRLEGFDRNVKGKDVIITILTDENS
ncbi:hypothetical protein HTZ84_19030 [Haloterrigena sp. SYSU A558-1]|uniref:Uncharacterized protein n=1 Tax=Haloterrigena gelatinilytica TaxID=2741724 RepID=A0ABX2LKP9_9EURY|nr:hypothetical protein [Haloterrigena gelatinilytica]NUC74361.1 hypothetical protein [Haloterrigena gelatinilytica]